MEPKTEAFTSNEVAGSQILAEAHINGIYYSVTSDGQDLPYSVRSRHEFGFGNGEEVARSKYQALALIIFSNLIQGNGQDS